MSAIQHEDEELAVKRRMPENLRRHLIRVQGGKNYLPAAFRLVWFRDAEPDWGVQTFLLEGGQEAGFATVQAHVTNSDGRILATGMKTETRQDFPAGWVEKAETGAIARALAVAGFGTQFSQELDDVPGETRRPADSPQHMRPEQNRTPVQPRRNSDPDTNAMKHERVDGELVHQQTIDPRTNRPAVIKRDEEPDPHYEPRSTAEDAALGKHLAWLGGWMTNKKLDKNDRELAIYLLNMAAGDLAGDPWTSRKQLSEDNWALCKKVLIGVNTAQLNQWVLAYTERKNDDGSSPFSDAPAAGIEPCPACKRADLNCLCTLEEVRQARADAEGAKLSGTLIDVPVAAGGKRFGED